MQIIEFRPPRIALALLLIAAVIQFFFATVLVVLLSLPILGFVLGSLGLGLMFWGWFLFRAGFFAVCPSKNTERMIFYGPFRFSRNPMYLGMVLILLGIALFIGTLPFFLAAIIMFLILNFFFIPFEERELENGFGEEFRLYKRTVRRWL